MDNSSEKGKLGLWSCVTLIIGGMIGSAIFSLSGLTVYNAGPAAIISWVLSAAIMLGYGLVIAELSSVFPKSGGVYVFPRRALGKTPDAGRFWGWVSTWGYFIANITAMAFSAIYVGTYLSVGFPAFAGMQVPLALAAIVFVLVLNSLRVSVMGKANLALTSALAATLIVFAVAGLSSGEWDAALLTPFFTQGAAGASGFISVIPTAMVAYGSVVAIAFMVSDVRTPQKNVPRSMLIAMGVTVVLYGLVIVTMLGLVSADYLAENPGMRFIPLYAACFTKLSSIPFLAKVVSVSAVLALLTTMLVVLALTSRVLKAAADEGILPSFFAKTLGNGSPLPAAAAMSVISGVVACFPQFTSEIVNLGALTTVIGNGLQCFALIASRKKFPAPEGGFRAPGGSALAVAILAIFVACYIPGIRQGGWLIWAYTAAIYAAGVVVFLFRKREAAA